MPRHPRPVAQQLHEGVLGDLLGPTPVLHDQERRSHHLVVVVVEQVPDLVLPTHLQPLTRGRVHYTG